ncbi:conserved exported hypothetical protein [Candidatus Nitrosotenuis uzonensis]|uniref:Uncharacterized protein n=1 Tax=Candidatus Nitrosotenuis uzonensis TaxID=1407055 RepID=A0A812F4Y8_9ARCH|nr:conserved exported hypothetical protein [Candidatus Nitrosotenuis uzonensis]
MKLSTTTLVLGVALAVVAGLFSSTIFGITGIKSDAQTSTTATGLITGHVVTTLTDSDGNIKAYRQSDNLIVNNGENCVSKMLFGASGGGSTGSNVCTGAITEGFRYIAIGNSSTAVTSADTGLGAELTASGLGAKFSTITWTNSTGSGSGTTAQAVMAATFTNSGSTQAVRESGLFNGTNASTNGMFARQTFSDITMNNGDSLTVQWTINIGGTANALTP